MSLLESESLSTSKFFRKEKLFPYSQMKFELNEIWKDFMTSFNFDKYYQQDTKIKASKATLDSNFFDGVNESINRSLSIKKLNKFLKKYSINILEDKTLYIDKESKERSISEILSEAKLWIMYILITVDKSNNNTNDESISCENKIFLVVNLFNEAIKNRCDLISLFEFFLIYLSSIPNEEYELFLSDQTMKILPKEFFILYSKKKTILRNIFDKANENNPFKIEDITEFEANLNRDPIDIEFEKEFNSFMRNEKEEKEYKVIIIEENKRMRVLDNNYLNQGFFALLQEDKSDYKEKYIEVENYLVMPLKMSYSSYDEKIKAEKTLDMINNSLYKDYIYYPYNSIIISQL